MNWDPLSDEMKTCIAQSKILLLQREIPDEINLAAAKTAKDNGVFVVMDMGGRLDPLLPEILQYIDVISPNETELSRITGIYDTEAAAQ